MTEDWPVWSAGRWLDPQTPLVPAGDRAVQAGVGLFETFRTYAGRPLLWPRHRARLERSARELGVPFDPAQLPDPMAMAELWRQGGADLVIRVTLSGGGETGPVVWMAGRPLPPRPPGPGLNVIAHPGWTAGPLAPYKSLNYWPYVMAFDAARARGADEALLVGPPVFEGSRTNLLVVRGGRVATPESGCLRGVMRDLLIELAGTAGLPVRPGRIEWDDLVTADEIILTNSVWGPAPVSQLVRPGPSDQAGGSLAILERVLESPGPVARRLAGLLTGHLTAELARW